MFFMEIVYIAGGYIYYIYTFRTIIFVVIEMISRSIIVCPTLIDAAWRKWREVKRSRPRRRYMEYAFSYLCTRTLPMVPIYIPMV